MSSLLGSEDEVLQKQSGELGDAKAQKSHVLLGAGSLTLAAIEAICLFFVSANGLILLLGGLSAGVAQSVVFFHSAPVRLPLLALATIGALLNLWLLFNAWRLRSAPSAQWRRKPLLPAERRRIVIVAVLSVVTLTLVGTELYLHHKYHGSAFARLTAPSIHLA
jgi:hypothetical protein